MSIAPSTLFREIVQNVLNNWTALRLAVEHQMGGPQSHDSALKLIDYITELCITNLDIEAEDIADTLTDIMDSEFQTLCEDNSPEEVGKVLYQFWQYCKVGNVAAVQEDLNKLLTCQKWLEEKQATCNTPNRSTLPVSKSDESDPENSTGDNMDTGESEWTTVKSKRK